MTGKNTPPWQSPSSPPPDDEEARSPIRPEAPRRVSPRPRLIPAKPPTGPLEAEPEFTPARADSDEIRPEQALEELRQRMRQVAEEFASGRINRAQFHAIYNRYSEQRNIIEKLLARDPQSSAWQQVARPGHTSFLRQHFAARVLFFALFPIGQLAPIVHHGSQFPAPEDVLPILQELPAMLNRQGTLPPGRKRTDDGYWLVVVPGMYTATVILYSLEPSIQQMQKIADLHYDFERANAQALAQQDYRRDHLVFPQRALFETPKGSARP